MFLLLSLFIGFNIAYAEYRIKAGVIPSYLNYSFYNLSEDVFPADLTIVIHLSRVLGTLLYSVDSNDNQLIISINDENNPTLDIEFSKEHIYVSLAKLCNLEWTKYTKLSLRIQMREVIYLQCNDGPMDSYKYQRTHQLNKDYPVPSFSRSEKMQAKLWLVNTPHVDGIYPNNAQLSGCIFDVRYKKKSLKMGKYGVEDKCPITCTKNICNSGHCLETYNSIPVCNCTSAFNNGDYCNKTRYKGTCETNDALQFTVLKIVFKPSNDGGILRLTNRNSEITLQANEDYLFLRIRSNETYGSLIEIVVTNTYSINERYIAILTFKVSSVDFQFLRNGSSWTEINIPYYKDLSREVFTFMRLVGEEIYCAYKNNIKEIRWMEFNSNNKSNVTKVFQNQTTNNNQQSTISSTLRSSNILNAEALVEKGNQEVRGLVYLNNKVSWMFGIIIILNLIIFVTVAVLLYTIRKRKGGLWKLSSSEKSNSFNEEQDTGLLNSVNHDILKNGSNNGHLTFIKEPPERRQ